MAQQTAVEWMDSELRGHIKICNTKYVQQEEIHIPIWMYNKLLEQAKQMEKEQLDKAYYQGQESKCIGGPLYTELYNK